MKEHCFADKGDECNALKRKECEGCKFYKAKSKVKNNIFYPKSFKNYEEYLNAVKRYTKKYGPFIK